MQRLSLLLLLTTSIFLSSALERKPLKILVYSPLFGGSHSKFMGSLADTLTEAGHDVTYLVPIADQYGGHHHGARLTQNVIIVPRDGIMEARNVSNDASTKWVWTLDMSNPDFEKMFSPFTQMMLETCSNLLRNEKTLSQLANVEFDVALTEPLSVCGLAIFEKFGISKTILTSSTSLFDYVLANTGEPQELSYVPSMSAQSGDKMTMWERYQNYRLSQTSGGAIEKMFDQEAVIYREHLGQSLPDWKDLLSSASLFFTNSNPYVDFPRPVLQKTVAIGGISVDLERIKSEKLDKEWDDVLNLRPRTMLISFGSMAKSREMPENFKRTLLNVIKSEKDVTFIWKYESEDVSFAADTPNVYFSKWVPQTALLADPRLSAFLTHGGLGSTLELAYCGTPALMVPLTFDQVRNSNMLVRHKSVKMMEKTMLGNEKMLREAFRDLLYDENYRENAKKLAQLLNDQPHRPKDLLVKHTEFVAKHGPFPQMDPFGRQLNFFQKNLLDVFAIFAVLYFLATCLILFLITIIYRKFKLFSSYSSSEQKKDL